MYYNSEPQSHPAGDSPAEYSAGTILLLMKQKKGIMIKMSHF